MTVAVATIEDLLFHLEARDTKIAALEERIAKLEGERAQRPAAAWMTPKAYAARVGLSSRKVAELIAAGMPSRRIGRARRVDVAAADAWIKERGGA